MTEDTTELLYSYLVTWRKEVDQGKGAWTSYSEVFRSFKEAWEALQEKFEDGVESADLDLMVGNVPDGDYWQLLAKRDKLGIVTLSRSGESHLSLVL